MLPGDLNLVHEKNWTDTATLYFMELMKSRKDELFGNSVVVGKKVEVWSTVADLLRQKGFMQTTHSVMKKFYNMRRTYVIIKKHKKCPALMSDSGSSKGKQSGRGKRWRYYDAMIDLLGDNEETTDLEGDGPSTEETIRNLLGSGSGGDMESYNTATVEPIATGHLSMGNDMSHPQSHNQQHSQQHHQQQQQQPVTILIRTPRPHQVVTTAQPHTNRIQTASIIRPGNVGFPQGPVSVSVPLPVPLPSSVIDSDASRNYQQSISIPMTITSTHSQILSGPNNSSNVPIHSDLVNGQVHQDSNIHSHSNAFLHQNEIGTSHVKEPVRVPQLHSRLQRNSANPVTETSSSKSTRTRSSPTIRKSNGKPSILISQKRPRLNDDLLIEEVQGMRHEIRGINRNLEKLVDVHNRLNDNLEKFLTIIRIRME